MSEISDPFKTERVFYLLFVYGLNDFMDSDYTNTEVRLGGIELENYENRLDLCRKIAKSFKDNETVLKIIRDVVGIDPRENVNVQDFIESELSSKVSEFKRYLQNESDKESIDYLQEELELAESIHSSVMAVLNDNNK